MIVERRENVKIESLKPLKFCSVFISASPVDSSASAATASHHCSAASSSDFRRASCRVDMRALSLKGTDGSEHEPQFIGVCRLPSYVVRWVSYLEIGSRLGTHRLEYFFQSLVLLLPSMLSVPQV